MRKRWIPLGALLLVVLAACSGDTAGSAGEAAANPTTASASPTEVPSGVTADCEVGETDGELALYNWTEYIDPNLITKFRDEFGVDVVEDYFPNNEEMLARVEPEGSDYDVLVPSDYMVGIMIERDLLLVLDKDAIPNARNVAQEFRSPPFDPQQAFHMPYQWGTTGLGISKEVAGENPEPTWGWIFDPQQADGLDGRITLLDDPRAAMGAALAYLGYSLNSTNEAEIQQAADLVAETTQRLKAFDSDQYEDLLVANETVAAQGYSGDFFQVFDQTNSWDRFSYVLPREGAQRWVDTMVIPADAPHPCTAHTFINFILDPENGAALTNFNFYASPNKAAEQFIDAEILDDAAIYPPADVSENLHFIEDTGPLEATYTDLFTQAKG